MYSTWCTDAPDFELSKRRLAYVDRELSVLDASRVMRTSGAAELLLTDSAEGTLLPVGVVTASPEDTDPGRAARPKGARLREADRGR